MKKFVFMMIGFFLVFAVLGLLTYVYVFNRSIDISRVIPEKTPALIKVVDVQGQMEQLFGTEIFQTVMSLDFNDLQKNAVITEQQKEMFLRLKAYAAGFERNVIFDKFFGEECYIGVYEEGIDLKKIMALFLQSDPSFVNHLFSNLYVVTRLKPEARFIEAVFKMFKQDETEVIITSDHYRGFTVNHAEVPGAGLTVSFVRIHDLLVAGFGQKAAYKAVDIYRKQEPSVAESENYARLVQQYVPSADITVYLNGQDVFRQILEQSRAMFSALSEEQKARVGNRFEKNLETFLTYRSLGVSADWNSPSHIRASISIDEQRKKQISGSGMCPSSVNESLSLVPSDLLVYSWTGCFDFTGYWKDIQEEVRRMSPPGSQQDPLRGVRNVEAFLGMPLNDIFAALGNEAGGYLKEVQVTSGQMVPVPKAVMFLKVKDKNKIEELMRKIMDQQMFAKQEEDYQGIRVVSLDTPLQVLNPAYCFWKDYLLLAFQKDLLTMALDTAEGRLPGITSAESFKKIDQGLSGKNQFVAFVNAKKLWGSIQVALQMFRSHVQEQMKKQDAFQAGPKKRLKELAAQAQSRQQALLDIRKNLDNLDDRIWDARARQEDTDSLTGQKESLQKNFDEIQAQAESLEKQQQELKVVVASYSNARLMAERQIYFMDKAVLPVLKGIESVGSYGIRSAYENGWQQFDFIFQ